MRKDLFVSICIATCLRSQSLGQLLGRLDALDFTKNPQPNIEVIVVDNDAGGSAREIVEQRKQKSRWTIRYAVELQRGVTFARNRSLRLVSKRSEFIVMIDDDEIPDTEWLDELLWVQSKWGSDVVTGPVLPIFDTDVPEWVKTGGFFTPRRYASGTLMPICHTNNVLVRAPLLKYMGEPFDNRLALKGGEDAYLFMQLRKKGYNIRWADQAVVHERIPKTRARIKWLINRSFWGWSSYSRFEKELYPSPRRQAMRATKGFGLILKGVSQIMSSAWLGKTHLAASVLEIAKGAGSLAGLLGVQGRWPR